MKTDTKSNKLKLPPNTNRSAWILYRLLQLRYATRKQIQKLVFGEFNPGSEKLTEKSQKKQMSDHIGRMLKEEIDWLRQKERLIYVSNEGREKLINMLTDNRLKKVTGWTEAFDQIDRSLIEDNPNLGAGKQYEHQLNHYLLLIGH